jgi:hypothetical protein
MELAIINGTYRDSSIKAVATAAGIRTELFWSMGACFTSYVPFA